MKTVTAADYTVHTKFNEKIYHYWYENEYKKGD
jgi:hypothetical protein